MSMKEKDEEKVTNPKYIGYVKFYDVKKGFGYIASNKKGMQGEKFYRDFYIDDSSWIDNKEISQYVTVVFQLETQDNGRKRAYQVRKTTSSQDDIDLIMSYYGEYEIVLGKDDKNRYLIAAASVDISEICKHVTKLIELQVNRTSHSTLELFNQLISHSKINAEKKTRKYVFDRAFKSDSRLIWQNLFDAMTNEEKELVLKNYPSSQQYFGIDILVKHLELLDLDYELPKEISNQLAIQDIDFILGNKNILEEYDTIMQKTKFLQESISEDYIKKIKAARKEAIDSVICNAIIELDEDILTQFVSKYKYRRNSYSDFFTDEEKLKFLDCRDEIKYRIFKKQLLLVGAKMKASSIEEIVSLYDKLSDKMKKTIMRDRGIKKELALFLYEAQSFIIQELSSDKFMGIKSENIYYSVGLNCYNRMANMFNENNRETIKKSIIEYCINTKDCLRLNRLEAVSFLTNEDYNESMSKIMEELGIDEIVKLLLIQNSLIEKDLLLRIVTLLEGRSFLQPLINDDILKIIEDDKDDPFGRLKSETPECDIVVQRNAELIIFIFDKIKNNHEEDLLERYAIFINSIEDDEFIRLIPYLRSDIIGSPKESVVKRIVNTISQKDGDIGKDGVWVLKNEVSNKYKLHCLLSIANAFEIIREKVLSIDLSSKDNIPYALFWINLLSFNKPTDDEDYYIKKKWDDIFETNLALLKTLADGNRTLQVLLWATYFKTKASLSALSSVFPFLDRNTQIRVFRKIIQLIELGKLSYGIEELHSLLCPSDMNVCLAIDICITYLRMRNSNPNSSLDEKTIYNLISNRPDHEEWIEIKRLMTKCEGRSRFVYFDDVNMPNEVLLEKALFKGIVEKIVLTGGDEVFRISIWDKLVDYKGQLSQKYNNKYRSQIDEFLRISIPKEYIKTYSQVGCTIFDVSSIYEMDIRLLAMKYKLYYKNILSETEQYSDDTEGTPKTFCEFRMANNFDKESGKVFMWCDGKQCASVLPCFHVSSEWEQYTMLDFMRILKIPFNYTRTDGSCVRYGHYLILSSFLESFKSFYDHLKCRMCGKLMNAANISNFAAHNITDFCCTNSQCSENGEMVYLNHCFNKTKCRTIIDSRDSKQCPNGYYICPNCGCCCSTSNVSNIISRHSISGGIVSPKLKYFVDHSLGHLERLEYYCYKCGKQMQLIDGKYQCAKCGTEYKNIK